MRPLPSLGRCPLPPFHRRRSSNGPSHRRTRVPVCETPYRRQCRGDCRALSVACGQISRSPVITGTVGLRKLILCTRCDATEASLGVPRFNSTSAATGEPTSLRCRPTRGKSFPNDRIDGRKSCHPRPLQVPSGRRATHRKGSEAVVHGPLSGMPTIHSQRFTSRYRILKDTQELFVSRDVRCHAP